MDKKNEEDEFIIDFNEDDNTKDRYIGTHDDKKMDKYVKDSKKGNKEGWLKWIIIILYLISLAILYFYYNNQLDQCMTNWSDCVKSCS